MSDDLKPGDRVRIESSGETGRVHAVDGAYVVVDEDSGYSTRLAARDVIKMDQAMSTFTIHVSQQGPGFYVDCGPSEVDKVEAAFRQCGTKFYKTKTRADGGAEYAANGSGDRVAAALGVQNMSMMSASTPHVCAYCNRNVVGAHRSVGGICPGSDVVMMAATLYRGDNVTSPKHGKRGVVLDPANGTNLAGKPAALVRWDDGSQSQESTADLQKV